MPRLKSIKLLHHRVERWDDYPFCVPAIASLQFVQMNSPVYFFVGDNGSGKSTLLEAIAAHYGFGREGGSRNFRFETTATVRSSDPLINALQLAFTSRTGAGFYLRAESFFNVASYIDEVDKGYPYRQKSLHEQSHGESLISLLQRRLSRPGLFLMDEPEAALSPQRQLGFLALLYESV